MGRETVKGKREEVSDKCEMKERVGRGRAKKAVKVVRREKKVWKVCNFSLGGRAFQWRRRTHDSLLFQICSIEKP